MKKLLLLIALPLCFALSAAAQTAPTPLLSNPVHVPTDTLTNAGTVAQYVKVAPGYLDKVTFQASVTKISGTVAGSVQLQGSLDGIAYGNIGTSTTLTDVGNQIVSIATVHDYISYRLLYTGTGTQAVKVYSNFIGRVRPR